MDTLKQVVSWLESFPPDIWAHFVFYLPGEQLGRLLMTGSTLIWHRLKSPRVVKSVKLGTDLMIFKSLPTLLNDFPSLDELCIYSQDFNWARNLGLKINVIPSGLKKLEINGFWPQGAHFLFEADGAAFKLNEYLPHLEVLDLDYWKSEDCRWMIHSPQSLTRLALHHWDGTVELPASLIHFEASHLHLSKSSFVSKLPPSLECFMVAFWLFGVDLVVPLLPPSTRKLDLGRLPSSESSELKEQNILEHLPKSLTWFKLPAFPGSNFEDNATSTLLLPSTLTELDIVQDLPCSAWSLLPQHLTNLSFQIPKSLCTAVSTIIDGERDSQTFPFQKLPKSIASLHLSSPSFFTQCFCGPPAASIRPFFPPQLTTLKMPVVQLAPDAAKLLPSSLTFLEIGNFCERVCEHLPTGLKTLIALRTLMGPNLFKFLPKSLTVLTLSVPPPDKPWFDYRSGKMLECISDLPEYATYKKCSSKDYDWKDSATLPASLTRFELSHANTLGDSFLQQRHLNLLEMRMGYATNFTDLSIPLLSAHLTTLNFNCSSKISGKSFSLLPRCLTHINLNCSEFIFDVDIQHLPRTLKRAQLTNAIHLTDLCIADLPPRLEVLEMANNALITPASFPHLPYPQRSSQIYKSAEFKTWRVDYGVVVRP